ncbi:hypothetical protein FALCPG4_009254 [Fusarium falciforme]
MFVSATGRAEKPVPETGPSMQGHDVFVDIPRLCSPSSARPVNNSRPESTKRIPGIERVRPATLCDFIDVYVCFSSLAESCRVTPLSSGTLVTRLVVCPFRVIQE